MAHQTHFFIIKRDFGPKIGWGYIGEEAASLNDCADAILDSFASNDMDLQATPKTVLVLEIDGSVAMNRTEDVLTDCAASLTARDLSPWAWRDMQACAA
jgi:hypothetical protein